MKNQNGQPELIAELRKRAEEIVRDTAMLSPEYLQTRSPEEIRRMFHELQVHQIEMKNEDLRRAEVARETTRARMIGAEFNLSSQPGKGTQITLRIPFNCKRAKP